jgi:predicted glutamine amidotransferase
MCRILFGTGDGEKVEPLFEALIKSAENDPYKERRGRGRQHRDGWGYLLLDLDSGSTLHYRSTKPIFDDTNGTERLLKNLNGRVALMVHARDASQGAVNLFNVQPFSFSSKRGFSYWVLHNGDLDKEKIIELADLDGKNLEEASDSYAFATYLCRRLENTSPQALLRRYREILKTTKTVFNTMGTFHDSRRGFNAFITAYMVDSYLSNPLQRDYAKLLLLKEKDLFAVSSSTLELYHESRYKEVPNGTAFYIKLSHSFNVEEMHL